MGQLAMTYPLTYPGPAFQVTHLDDSIEYSNISVFPIPGNPSVVPWLYEQSPPRHPSLRWAWVSKRPLLLSAYALQTPVLTLDLHQVLIISEGPGRGQSILLISRKVF